MNYSPALLQYAFTLNRRYEAREAGSCDIEDELLSVLDRIWLGMSEAEREQSDSIARETKRNFYAKISTHPNFTLGLEISRSGSSLAFCPMPGFAPSLAAA